MDLRTEAVGAFLLSGNEAVRLSFEQNLARELNKLGIEAIPGYELIGGKKVTDKEKILGSLKGTGVDHAVFMKVVGREKEVTYVPGSVWYGGVYYDPFIGPWGAGAWPYYDPGYYRVDTVVSVETLVYSIPDSKLLWAGLSKTMNPDEVDDFVEDLVKGAVKEMRKTGFVRKES
jgi:hypothetical protein